MVEATQLSKAYRSRQTWRTALRIPTLHWALQEVSLRVETGTRVGLIGANGAGKSTLLKCLAGLTDPTRGQVQTRGRIAGLIELGGCFHPELTGRENVRLYCALLGMSHSEWLSKCPHIFEYSELEAAIDRPVRTYSSGMVVRLAFSVIAHFDAAVLLIDEAIAVGDAAFQQKCLKHLSETAGLTCLVVSHNLGLLSRLCSSSAVLAQGKLVFRGETSEAIGHYLGLGSHLRSHYTAPPNRGPLQLLQATLRNGTGSERSHFAYQDSILVTIDYRLDAAIIGMSVGIGLGTTDGIPILGSTDRENEIGQSLRREAGSYRSQVEIPAKLLNTGEYIVQVYLTRGEDPAHWQTHNALRFRVEETGTPSVRAGLGARGGLIQPQLNWNRSELNQDAVSAVAAEANHDGFTVRGSSPSYA